MHTYFSSGRAKRIVTLVALMAAFSGVAPMAHAALDGGGGGGGGGGGITPTATLSASPTSITAGGSSTLTWSSTGATGGCVGTNFSTGGLASGSVSVAPGSTVTYSIVCTRTATGATASASQTVTVSATPLAPTASLSANPSSVVVGNSSTLTWSSTNATACTGTNFSTGNATAGSVAVAPGSTTSYQVTCTGAGGSANYSTTVTVTAPSSSTWTLHEDIEVREYGSCPPYPQSTRQGTCGAGGVSAGQSCSPVGGQCRQFYNNGCLEYMQVFCCGPTCGAPPVPSAVLTASPESISSGQSTTLSYACTDSSSASIDQGVGSVTVQNGTKSVSPASTKTYTLTCLGAGGSATSAATVTVAPAAAVTASLSANPLSLLLGASTVLTWSSTGASSCVGTGFLTSGATSGTVTESPTSTTQYVISCSSGSGTTGGGGTWESGSWWTGGTQTVVYGETVHDNGQQGDLCPNAALNAGYSAWNEQFVRYPNRCGDAGCDLAVITCYGVNGATGTTNKPAEYNGGLCITSTAQGCRDTTYRRSGATSGGGGGASGNATDSKTVTVTTTQCTDGVDNDADSRVDMADSGCSLTTDDTESPDAITATLTNNGPIRSGQSATLTWSSTGASSCTGTGFSTGGSTGSNVSTGILTVPPTSYQYSVNCSGAVANTTVSLTNPIAYIMANPDRVNSGSPTQLAFSAAGLTPSAACRVTGPTGTVWDGQATAAGVLATTTSTSAAITQKSTFTISCDNASATDTVIVNLVARFEEF